MKKEVINYQGLQIEFVEKKNSIWVSILPGCHWYYKQGADLMQLEDCIPDFESKSFEKCVNEYMKDRIDQDLYEINSAAAEGL